MYKRERDFQTSQQTEMLTGTVFLPSFSLAARGLQELLLTLSDCGHITACPALAVPCGLTSPNSPTLADASQKWLLLNTWQAALVWTASPQSKFCPTTLSWQPWPGLAPLQSNFSARKERSQSHPSPRSKKIQRDLSGRCAGAGPAHQWAAASLCWQTCWGLILYMWFIQPGNSANCAGSKPCPPVHQQ